MTELNRRLFEQAIDLKLDLMRLDKAHRAEIIKILKDLEKEILGRIASEKLTEWGEARLKKQLKSINEIISASYQEVSDLNLDTLARVARVSSQSTNGALIAATGGQVQLAALPSAAEFVALAETASILGHTPIKWWQRQSDDTIFKFEQAIRMGIAAADTPTQTANRVKDMLGISRRNAEVLTRTAIQSVSYEARQNLFNANADIMDADEWVATLDLKTCPTCGPRDGKRWGSIDRKPIGHSIPYAPTPLHPGCRCTIVPALKPLSEIGVTLPTFEPKTRSSMDGMIENKTFEEWLATKTQEQQNEVLGVGRAELWRNKVITFDQLLKGGKPLTLKQLEEKYLKD